MAFDPQPSALEGEQPLVVEDPILPEVEETSVEARLTASDPVPVIRPLAGLSRAGEALCAAMASSLVGFARLSAEERGLWREIEAITCVVTGTHGPAPAFRLRRLRTSLVIDGRLSDHDKARIVLEAGAAAIGAH